MPSTHVAGDWEVSVLSKGFKSAVTECGVQGSSSEGLTAKAPKAMGKEAPEGAFVQAQKEEGSEASFWVQLASLPLCLQK